MGLLIVLDSESVNLDGRGKVGMIFLRFFFNPVDLTDAERNSFMTC